MQLTQEQIAIINSTGDIRINAVAGSGKTTTLIEYARARKDQGKILYLAFNRSVKVEAEQKFLKAGLKNVRIETAHSLAYNYIIKDSNYRLKAGGNYKSSEVVDLLDLKKGHDM